MQNVKDNRKFDKNLDSICTWDIIRYEIPYYTNFRLGGLQNESND